MTAALGNTIDLMGPARQGPLIVQEGESLNITGQLVDFAGVAIPKSGLLAFQATLYDEATETIINGLAQQDRLSEVATDGHLTIKLDAPDNTIINPSLGSKQLEKHIVALVWRWNDGTQDRTGIQLVRFRVQRMWVQVIANPM